MFAEKPSRYIVEWDDSECYERLKARAVKRGTFMSDCDDWFEPQDIVEREDGINSIEAARRIARQHADGSVYGQARILERRGIVEVGAFWDCDEEREIETIGAGQEGSK